ncbi:hypothetical protein R1sor_013786 [Riccia sorocarpa]|uniref:Uncharacterized protein n=1 Tax=Riccia sorocarpa TaxID=122646 RepID=A0ABD3HAH4_9MARC
MLTTGPTLTGNPGGLASSSVAGVSLAATGPMSRLVLAPLSSSRNVTGVIVSRALELYEQKNLLNLVDAGLLGQYNEEEVLLILQTAVACCQMDLKKRPTMSQVMSRFMKHEDVPIDITEELNP